MIKASSLGLWPGHDPLETDRIILGELGEPHLPFLPQLPQRGVAASTVASAAAVLIELPVDLQSYGWRLVQRPGADLQRARSFLSSDLNILADLVGARETRLTELKIQLMGPLSLAASLHLPMGERAISDQGARREIAQSLGTGLGEYLRAVHGAVPGARIVLQVNEPEAGRILAGTIPTVSGYRRIRAVPRSEVRASWQEFIEAARTAGANETVLAVPKTAFSNALESGAEGVSVSLEKTDSSDWELFAAAIEADRQLWLGIDTILDSQLSTRQRAEALWRSWRTIGLPATALSQLRLTEATELTALSPTVAKSVLGRLVDLSDALGELADAD